MYQHTHTSLIIVIWGSDAPTTAKHSLLRMLQCCAYTTCAHPHLRAIAHRVLWRQGDLQQYAQATHVDNIYHPRTQTSRTSSSLSTTTFPTMLKTMCTVSGALVVQALLARPSAFFQWTTFASPKHWSAFCERPTSTCPRNCSSMP